MGATLQKGEYIAYRDLWPDRIDIFTLLSSILLMTVTLLMVYWLGMLCYRTLNPDREEIEQIPSPSSVRVRKEMEYLGEDDDHDSTPLDWKIERPAHLRSERTAPSSGMQPILSDRDLDKTIRISNAAKGLPPRSRSSGDTPLSPPVLNVIWEPTQKEEWRMEVPQRGKHPASTIGHRQLISSIPVILKKPAPSGRGYIDEPVIINLYYDPSVPGEIIHVPKPNTVLTSNSRGPNGEAIYTAISSDAPPCLSVTTTKTRTRVTEPKPGYTKRVIETHTTTKQVTRTPIDPSLNATQPMSPNPNDITPTEEKDIKTAVEPQVKSAPSVSTSTGVGKSTTSASAKPHEDVKDRPLVSTTKDYGNVLAISSQTRGERIEEMPPSLRTAHSPSELETLPQVKNPKPSEKVILMTPDATLAAVKPISNRVKCQINRNRPIGMKRRSRQNHLQRPLCRNKTIQKIIKKIAIKRHETRILQEILSVVCVQILQFKMTTWWKSAVHVLCVISAMVFIVATIMLALYVIRLICNMAIEPPIPDIESSAYSKSDRRRSKRSARSPRSSRRSDRSSRRSKRSPSRSDRETPPSSRYRINDKVRTVNLVLRGQPSHSSGTEQNVSAPSPSIRPQGKPIEFSGQKIQPAEVHVRMLVEPRTSLIQALDQKQFVPKARKPSVSPNYKNEVEKKIVEE
ncbi:hypothetical protein RB195_016697 [Necator americanus]|uniref:Uncharacterized protein n=1 Tax=Necator americanus TaxID=51031 RepID=A0ABR1C4Y7_NECAM